MNAHFAIELRLELIGCGFGLDRLEVGSGQKVPGNDLEIVKRELGFQRSPYFIYCFRDVGDVGLERQAGIQFGLGCLFLPNR